MRLRTLAVRLRTLAVSQRIGVRAADRVLGRVVLAECREPDPPWICACRHVFCAAQELTFRYLQYQMIRNIPRT
jgi:hypothetical protein